MPSIWPWGGLGVALGGLRRLASISAFYFLLLLELTWNQPRKGASDAAPHSRSRSQNSLNAETQRFAARQSRNRTGQADRKMADRKMKRNPIFLSSIFLLVC